jgi:hypothetical protein
MQKSSVFRGARAQELYEVSITEISVENTRTEVCRRVQGREWGMS